MDIQVGDKLTIQTNYKAYVSSGWIVEAVLKDGRFRVGNGRRNRVTFAADGSHANYTIVSVESAKPKPIVPSIPSQDEHQKTRELIALSSLLLRLVSTGEALDHVRYDYAIAIDNRDDKILIDHCNEGFTYRLLSTPNEFSKPLKNVSMLRSLIMYGEES